ncbi:MAG: hypothetical protein RQ985_00695 [Dehalococcoidia bacterium]|jgi:predicted amidophosphoribosyltransferase|nr:hypothetical protein [Dehalococcoidia bacterium]
MDNVQNCAVCGEPLDGINVGLCNGCGLPFHFNTEAEAHRPECGQAWLHPQYLTVEFGCFICLGMAPGREPPVGLGH